MYQQKLFMMLNNTETTEIAALQKYVGEHCTLWMNNWGAWTCEFLTAIFVFTSPL